MATVWRSQRAFARFFAGKTVRILNNASDLGAKLTPASISVSSTQNYSNYAKSPFVKRIKEQYEFDIVKNPPEWAYVERLMPFESIPNVTPKETYPSGWIPPKEEAKNLPYFIARTRNHQMPIYLDLSMKGTRKISLIRRIEGDIWLLNDLIKEHLQKTQKRYVETRVHELGRFIEVKGDFVTTLRDWAYAQGF
ncbi:probable 39S ribosomal protein L49, mitochondrial [Bicyclus anynana]|uniref:Large ribosomal subunit protein mL49 n=1 Tax=Bicyclus anynana TaxID=110368 RepID=A0A6J1NKM2_BICAN|nr:probable 39S ribosomal protein L49, mitochondrial [Bicyclus anynana]